MRDKQLCCSVLWLPSWGSKYLEELWGRFQQEAWHPALGTCQKSAAAEFENVGVGCLKTQAAECQISASLGEKKLVWDKK